MSLYWPRSRQEVAQYGILGKYQAKLACSISTSNTTKSTLLVKRTWYLHKSRMWATAVLARLDAFPPCRTVKRQIYPKLHFFWRRAFSPYICESLGPQQIVQYDSQPRATLDSKALASLGLEPSQVQRHQIKALFKANLALKMDLQSLKLQPWDKTWSLQPSDHQSLWFLWIKYWILSNLFFLWPHQQNHSKVWGESLRTQCVTFLPKSRPYPASNRIHSLQFLAGLSVLQTFRSLALNPQLLPWGGGSTMFYAFDKHSRCARRVNGSTDSTVFNSRTDMCWIKLN